MLLRHAWRLIILVFGVTLLAGGLLMIFLPGPGLVVILLGLAVLATEFEWARRLLRRTRTTANYVGARFRRRRSASTAEPSTPPPLE